MSKKVNYPECEKLLQEGNTHSTLMEFIEWLYNNGFSIRHYERRTNSNGNSLVYDFMNVDTIKLDNERKNMLKEAANL